MRSAQLFRNGNPIRAFRPFWDSSRSQKFGKTTLKDEALPGDPYEGNFSFTECDQYTKVSVIGAAGRVGKTLSLLLKTCPLIDHLCLFDTDKSVKGVGVDISHIDTKCNVSYVCGMRNIQQALDAPDVVVIAAGCPASPSLVGKKLFEKNAPIIAGISEACARFCPKACIILITSPINSLLPVVGSVYQVITDRIPSRKLFGLTSLDVVRANTFVAEVVRKDPSTVIVPVIGGTSQDTIVPVISQMKPCCKIKRGETIALTECLKRAEENLMDCQNCGTRGASSLSTAYAGFRFTTSLVMALKGAENVIECAFVKSDVIPELEYLASPLKLGIRGIEYNFGYPPLSDYELAGLQQSTPFLASDIELGKAFVANIQDTIQKGLVWKRLSEETGKEDDHHGTDTRGKETGTTGKRRRQEERKRDEPLPLEEAQQTALKQEVYSQGVRNWAMRSSLRSFFRTGGENCNEIAADSILHSGTCREDPSLQTEKHLNELLEEKTEEANNGTRPEEEVPEENTPEEETESDGTVQPVFVQRPTAGGRTPSEFLQTVRKAAQPARGYHTLRRENHDWASIKSRPANEQKMLVPIRQAKSSLELMVRSKPSTKFQATRNRNNQYKSLKAAAKQKYRTFNAQKKFTPSASVLLLLDKKKKERAEKNLEIVTAEKSKKDEEGKKVGEEEEGGEEEEKEEEDEEKEEKEKPEEERQENEDSQLVIRKEKDKYRDFIFKQLRDLRRENEELKKQLTKLADDKRLESSLQSQSDTLELERTKLKACWLIMSSTMDAFSNFCKKFTSRTEEQLLDAARELENRQERQEEQEEQETEEEEYDDAVENLEEETEEAEENKARREKKTLKYDEKYFKFLQKLMEDQMETKLDEKKRNCMRK